MRLFERAGRARQEEVPRYGCIRCSCIALRPCICLGSCGHAVWGMVGIQKKITTKSFLSLFYPSFSNGDLALGEGLKQHNFDKGKVPSQTLSYDCQCKYCRHLIEQMLEAFPSLAYLLKDFRFTIPTVHVCNHLAVCMWLFAAAFKACTGRFHGETAEQIWAEFNLLGATTRQMAMGHRQDTIIQSLTGWNLRKFVQIGKGC